MKAYAFIATVAGLLALCRGAIKNVEPLSKLTPSDAGKHPSSSQDLEASASDRTFLIGKDYGYGSGGYASSYGGYGNNPTVGVAAYGPTGTGYYNRGGTGGKNIYRGYQSTGGYGDILGGGNTGWGYYGGGNYGSGVYGGSPGYGGYGTSGLGYGSYGTSGAGYNGYGTSGIGNFGYDDGYNRYGGRGYNRWSSLDGYGAYGGSTGNGYSGYGGYGSPGYAGSAYGSGYGTTTYPYGYRGSAYGSYRGYSGNPSGYTGYS